MGPVHQRSRLKSRIHVTVGTYGLPVTTVSDLFGRRGRQLLQAHMQAVPPHTAYRLAQRLAGVDALDQAIRGIEPQMPEVCHTTPAIERLRTLPGVGCILAVMASASGDMRCFPRPQA
jgi:transposase